MQDILHLSVNNPLSERSLSYQLTTMSAKMYKLLQVQLNLIENPSLNNFLSWICYDANLIMEAGTVHFYFGSRLSFP